VLGVDAPLLTVGALAHRPEPDFHRGDGTSEIGQLPSDNRDVLLGRHNRQILRPGAIFRSVSRTVPPREALAPDPAGRLLDLVEGEAVEPPSPVRLRHLRRAGAMPAPLALR